MLHQPPLRGWARRSPNPVSSGWAGDGRQGTRRSSRQLLQHDDRRPRKCCVRTSAAARVRETPTAGRSPPIIDRSRGMSGNRISAKGVDIMPFPTAEAAARPGCPVSRFPGHLTPPSPTISSRRPRSPGGRGGRFPLSRFSDSIPPVFSRWSGRHAGLTSSPIVPPSSVIVHHRPSSSSRSRRESPNYL